MRKIGAAQVVRRSFGTMEATRAACVTTEVTVAAAWNPARVRGTHTRERWPVRIPAVRMIAASWNLDQAIPAPQSDRPPPVPLFATGRVVSFVYTVPDGSRRGTNAALRRGVEGKTPACCHRSGCGFCRRASERVKASLWSGCALGARVGQERREVGTGESPNSDAEAEGHLGPDCMEFPRCDDPLQGTGPRACPFAMCGYARCAGWAWIPGSSASETGRMTAHGRNRSSPPGSYLRTQERGWMNRRMLTALSITSICAAIVSARPQGVGLGPMGGDPSGLSPRVWTGCRTGPGLRPYALEPVARPEQLNRVPLLL